MTGLVTVALPLGLTGLFAARVFVPMFAGAVTLRLAPQVEWLSDVGLLAGIPPGSVPTWFTDDLTLLVLGSLSLAELLAHKSEGARELLNTVDRWGKPVAALLTYLGVVSVADQALVQGLVGDYGIAHLMIGLLVGGGTFLTSGVNNGVLRTMIEVDEDDDAGLINLYSWAQDLWALFGIFFLILFPVVMVVLVLLAIGLLFLVQKWTEAREEKSRVACPACAEPMYRSAVYCGACGGANPDPTDVSWLGTSTNRPVPDLARHPYHLVTKKRCPRCATRFPRRAVDQACPACGTGAFGDREFVAAYDRLVSSRVPTVLLVCALLSFFPVIGLIPGIIYYRIALVAPYRRYLGRGRTFFLRWGVRILFFFLIMFQWVPLLGIAVVPIMAFISHTVYRNSFWNQLRRSVNVSPVPA
jgi:hypothetical protein